ncbi:MAG: WHG domain-containing protein [Candidatus Krumholzibacteriia bacterium]
MAGRTGRYHHGDLRAALLAEAAAMIADGGVSSVTMRAISGRLGVSRAAPYRHFTDKSALLVAVAAAGFEHLKNRLQAIDAGAPGSSVERFRRMGEAYVRFALENPAHYRLMYGKEALARRDVPELREAGDALLALLVGVVQAHQHSGGIKRRDPLTQAYVMWSAVHGLASLLVDGQIEANDVDGLIRQTTRTLLDGLRVRHQGP